MNIVTVTKRVFAGNALNRLLDDSPQTVWRFEQCRFESGALIDFGATPAFTCCEWVGRWQDCNFLEASLRDCRVSGTWRNCTWQDATVSRSRLADWICDDTDLLGMQFLHCDLYRCAWDRCYARWVHFEHCEMRRVTVRQCEMQNAGIARSTLLDVEIRNTDTENFDVQESEMIDTNLSEVDNSQLETSNNIWRFTR